MEITYSPAERLMSLLPSCASKGSIDASNFVEIVDKAQEIYQNPARNLILDLSEVP